VVDDGADGGHLGHRLRGEICQTRLYMTRR
jgi:hypothetical protein